MADSAPIRLFSPAEIDKILRRSGWEVLELAPSDVVAFLVGDDLVRKLSEDAAESSHELIDEWVQLERQLRTQACLQGCGREIQFVARKG